MFGTNRKVLLQGIYMCNMKALSLSIQKFQPRLSLLWTDDGQMNRQGDSYIPPPNFVCGGGGGGGGGVVLQVSRAYLTSREDTSMDQDSSWSKTRTVMWFP